MDLKLHFWISTRVFKLWTVSRNLCFSISRTGIFSKIIFVLRGSHEDAYFNRVVLHLLLNICKGVQFLVKWHVIEVIFQSFWSQAWNNYIVSHLFAEQLLLKDTSRKLPLRLGNLRKLVDKLWNNKKSFTLPMRNCTKKLPCGSQNFPKFLQDLSGTTTCKNIFQQVLLLLLLGLPQSAFIYSKLTIKALEKGVK